MAHYRLVHTRPCQGGFHEANCLLAERRANMKAAALLDRAPRSMAMMRIYGHAAN
jgi:hypothetical protein